MYNHSYVYISEERHRMTAESPKQKSPRDDQRDVAVALTLVGLAYAAAAALYPYLTKFLPQ